MEGHLMAIKQADLDAITQGIGSMLVKILDKKLAPAVIPEAQATNTVAEEVEYSDPVSQQLDVTEAKLVAQLEHPVHKIIRGRNGAVMVDVTAESISQLLDLRKTRSKWRTQTKIR